MEMNEFSVGFCKSCCTLSYMGHCNDNKTDHFLLFIHSVDGSLIRTFSLSSPNSLQMMKADCPEGRDCFITLKLFLFHFCFPKKFPAYKRQMEGPKFCSTKWISVLHKYFIVY
jgi:hypothetical protein